MKSSFAVRVLKETQKDESGFKLTVDLLFKSVRELDPCVIALKKQSLILIFQR